MERKSYLCRGAGLAWGRKRYFFWMYAASLVLAGIGALAWARTVNEILDHSLAADRLVHGFDVATFFALLSNPGMDIHADAQSSMFLIFVYFLVILFLTPGIVFSFVHDEKPSTGNLFKASGAYFWSFVRLVLWTALICLPILGLLSGIRGAVLKAVDARTGDERVDFAVAVGTQLIIGVIAILLRIWFDLAEFHLVRREDRKSRKTIGPAWRAMWSAPARLFGIHLAPMIAVWTAFAAGAWLWYHLPSAQVWMAFLLGQAMTMCLIAARYWQRAAEAAWFVANVRAELPKETEPGIPLPIAPTAATEPAGQ